MPQRRMETAKINKKIFQGISIHVQIYFRAFGIVHAIDYVTHFEYLCHLIPGSALTA
jgi:hypothetical protein